MSFGLTLSPQLTERVRTCEANFAVVGARGWLGRATLDILDAALGENITQRVQAFGSEAAVLALPSGRHVEMRPLSDLALLPQHRPTVFLHYAFLTKDRVDAFTPADYVRLNTQISQAVAIAVERVDTRSIFVPSSGAVYGPERQLTTDLAGNPYGALKLADERRFTALAEKVGCRLAIARVFNLAGPHINKHSAYALSSIINDVLRGGPIGLRAAHPVVRSYVHIGDLLAVAFALLCQPQGAEVTIFDTAGECEVEVGELARRAAACMGAPQMQIIRPEVAAAQSIGMSVILKRSCD
jgi:UDP-glucuronate decarboxylase